MWEDNVANVTLDVEPNAPLAYDLLLELHHPIVSTLGKHIGRLDRERERERERERLCPRVYIFRQSDGMLEISRYTFACRAVTDTTICALPRFMTISR